MRSKIWSTFFPRIAFCSTRTKAWQDRARFSTVSASRGWKRFVRGWYFDGNRRTIRRGQPSRGRCSDIYCSPFLSLFSISFVPLVPPCLLLFFFFPLFVLSSLSQTRSTAPSFFIYVIARHSRDRCRDALAITFICAGNWAREPNLADREIIALGYQVCIYEREKFERVVARSSDSALTFHLSRGCIFRFHEMYTVSSRLRTRKRISRKRTLVVPSLT